MSTTTDTLTNLASLLEGWHNRRANDRRMADHAVADDRRRAARRHHELVAEGLAEVERRRRVELGLEG